MITQTAFQQTLAKLRTINLHLRYLRLRLSANPKSTHRHFQQLTEIEQELQSIEQTVFCTFGRGGDPFIYWAYLILIELVEQTHQVAYALKLLTEEIFTDPEGVLLCLQNEAIAVSQLLNQIAELETAELVKS